MGGHIQTQRLGETGRPVVCALRWWRAEWDDHGGASRGGKRRTQAACGDGRGGRGPGLRLLLLLREALRQLLQPQWSVPRRWSR